MRISSSSSPWLGAAFVAAAAFAALTRDTAARADEAPPCDVFDANYTISANLELTDTPMGQGNGVYRIGPGTATVRFEPNGSAKLVGYEMVEHLSIDSKTLFWKTHVTTQSHTTVGADACGVVAPGSFAGRTLGWGADLHGVRTDGTITCDGSMCGSFGAPPPGTSALHIAPHDVGFAPWVFAPDMKTFTMARTWVSASEAPKQTAFIVLTGRETGRRCVTPPACPGRG
jgi:hypothetical protein